MKDILVCSVVCFEFLSDNEIQSYSHTHDEKYHNVLNFYFSNILIMLLFARCMNYVNVFGSTLCLLCWNFSSANNNLNIVYTKIL